MNTIALNQSSARADLATLLTKVGAGIARYGLVAILLFIGGLKFTHAEAMGIQPLVAHSPFLSWTYAVGSIDGVSRVIGSIEIILALLIASRPILPLASAIGSALAIGTFLTTLSFMLTTPGVWDPAFPLLSGTGAFLIKDLALLGAAVFTAGEALRATTPAEVS
jgi:uncharacterized membrane protein YkgB